MWLNLVSEIESSEEMMYKTKPTIQYILLVEYEAINFKDVF